MNELLDDILLSGLEKEHYTVAHAVVGFQGQVVYEQAVGKIRKYSRFDLASLTKPLMTALLTLRMAEEDQLSLTDKVSDFFFTKTLKTVTILDLMNHVSGLEAWHGFLRDKLPLKRPGFKKNRKDILHDILNKRSLRKSSGKCVYSDLGYILLGAILEKVGKTTLDELYKHKFLRPAKLSYKMHFRPLPIESKNSLKNYVPTEVCLHRAQLIQGVVQDENAYLMGGVAGHSGLFGSIMGVHGLLKQVRLARSQESQTFPHNSFQLIESELKKPRSKRGRFVYGFDTPDAKDSHFGSQFSRKWTICHLGYPGTSVAWDIEKDVWVILLTNATIYGRGQHMKKIKETRVAFHDEVAKKFL